MDGTTLATWAGAVATLIGAGLVWFQLRETRRQAMLAFEDALNREYRKLTAELPPEAFFYEELSDEEIAKTRAAFYRYFDFCNQQAVLGDKGRISNDAWKEWKEGIDGNLKRPAFRSALRYVYKHCDDFETLHRLFKID